MAEREMQHPQPPEERRQPWDIQGMAEALAAETELVEDPYHGQGVLFRIGLSRSSLAAWEHHEYVEAQNEAMQVRMAHVEPPGLDADGVVFYSNQPRQVLWIDRSGAMTTHAAGNSPAPEYRYPERYGALPAHAPLPERPPGPLEPAPQISAEDQVPEGPFQAFPAPDASEQREKSNRVELMGNVGWEPKYREFQSGNARLQFSISQHMEDGSTRWHTVKAFKERARKYKDAIHKGDAIHLVGGRATEKYRDRSGQEREREFLILWGLKPLAGTPRGL